MIELLLGDDAVALGAVHAGIAGAFSYPGTPATEIFEFIERYAAHDELISARWSTNEKVAYEEAMGMSYVGRRAIVSMKHVGLNVAADPFMSSSLTGANGGLVLAVADDPGMHSSQNEQDSRFYGDFAQIPIFEPSTQQEAYDMTREAFEVSERFHTPVMIRLVTRLAHSRANVVTRPPVDIDPLDRVQDWREWTLLPVNARRRFQRVLDLQGELRDYSESSRFNRIELRGRRGIITTGLARNYMDEALDGDASYSHLHIGVYPAPAGLVRRLVNHCDEILVIEEGYPLIERQLVGLLGVPGKTVLGKRSGALPPQGELTTEVVRRAIGVGCEVSRAAVDNIPGRPPQLCGGCPHCDTFQAVVDAIGPKSRPYFFSDIGCYTLGALPPYNAIDTCVDMGASISMAIGAAKGGAHPVVATIGDSTFLHSGMSSLLEAARIDAPITVVIMDNALVAMTGGQEAFATGEDLLDVIRGLGVDERHLVSLKPIPGKHAENVEAIRREINHRGLSVVVACRPCIHAKRRSTTEVVESAT